MLEKDKLLRKQSAINSSAVTLKVIYLFQLNVKYLYQAFHVSNLYKRGFLYHVLDEQDGTMFLSRNDLKRLSA